MATRHNSSEAGGSRSSNGGLGEDTIVDPTTGKPLAADTIQRVLFIASKVHVYQVPPLRSTKGYTAAEWTYRPAIFEARLRIFETEEATATPPPSSTSPLPGSRTAGATTSPAAAGPAIRVTIVLEDPSSGELFAAAPYNHPSAVSHCVDSSRFFAVRVVGEGGMRAVLGIGFEERPEAFDFGVALQDAAKVLGLDKNSSLNSSAATAAGGGIGSRSAGRAGAGTNVAQASSSSSSAPAVEGEKRDYSLKEGETIVVNIGSRRAASTVPSVAESESHSNTLFSIKPPPPPAAPSASEGATASSSLPLLAPPPTAEQVKREMRRATSEEGNDNHDFTDFTTASATTTGTSAQKVSAQELGFDDGEFGEFQ